MEDTLSGCDSDVDPPVQRKLDMGDATLASSPLQSLAANYPMLKGTNSDTVAPVGSALPRPLVPALCRSPAQATVTPAAVSPTGTVSSTMISATPPVSGGLAVGSAPTLFVSKTHSASRNRHPTAISSSASRAATPPGMSTFIQLTLCSYILF